jgi:hypothetical protein
MGGTNTVNGLNSNIRILLLGSQHSMAAFSLGVNGENIMLAPIFLPFDHTTVCPPPPFSLKC